MKIAVTGSSGFIGSFVCEKLVQQGYEVLGVDKKVPIKSPNDWIFKKVNILDVPELRSTLVYFKPNVILHLAARTDLGIGESLEKFKDNTEGTNNVINLCNEILSVERLVFTSTILVCPPGHNPQSETEFNPTTPYGESKAIGEQMIRKNLNKPWTIIRPTSIWGPSFGSHYHNFFVKVKKNQYVSIKGYNPRITFGYLGNFAFQLISLLKSESCIVDSKVFYFGDYDPVDLRLWAVLISSKIGAKKIRLVDIRILRGLAWLGDLFHKLNIGFPLSSYRLKNLTSDRIYTLDRTKEICPTLPYSLEDGTEETIKWLKQNKII